MHLVIKVKSEDQQVTKTLDELWSFQILRLYEIYTNEQMDLAILREGGEADKAGVDHERKEKIRNYIKKVSELFGKVLSSTM